MDLQLPLISFDTTKAKLVKLDIALLPTNEELVSPSPARDFVQDILIRGQLDPIHLCKISKDKYYVIAGRRRIKAFREIQKIEPDNGKWKTIDALVVETSSETAILAASAENNRRSSNVLTDLQALDYLLSKDPNMSMSNLAKFSGMSQGTVKSRLKLKKLQPELLQGLIDGKMTALTAEKAAVLPQEFQSKLLIQLVKEDRLSLEDVSESQRVRVQETVDNQLVFSDMGVTVFGSLTDVSSTVFVPDFAYEDVTMVFRGYAVFSIGNNYIMNQPTLDRVQAQSDLEAYQAQTDKPEDLIIVTIRNA